MKVRKALSIDEIYSEVRDYDLVLTVEAPLAESLNKRVEKPFLGNFSITPRRLVYEEHPIDLMDKRDLFHVVVEETGFSWKKSAYLLDNVIDCWIETGRPDKILDYPGFSGEDIKKVLEVLKNTDNIFRAMDRYEVDDKDVAVVGLHQFKELDKKVLPSNFDVIDIFKDSETELPSFNIFNSSVEIVKALSRNISIGNANEIALALDSESEYQPLVTSMLESKGIPYMTQRELTMNMDLRNFLLFCRTATQQTKLKIGELQPLLKIMDIEIDSKYNQQYVSKIEKKDLKKFIDNLNRIKNNKISEALKIFFSLIGREIEEISSFFSETDLLDREVNEESIDLIEFYLDVFDVSWETDDYGGVLFVSPGNVAWVDRPAIFHLGMDSGWTKEPPSQPWIDRDGFEETKIKNFKVLLQNRESYYLVQDKHMNEDVVPCFYFNEVFDTEIQNFTDLPHKRYNEEPDEQLNGFDKIDMDMDIEIDEVDVISQSKLNKFVECPRNYYFDKIIPTADQDYFRKGNLFHEFAELYINHPEQTKENLDDIIDFMIEEMEPLTPNFRLPLIKTEFKVGTKNIINYLDENKDKKTEIKGYEGTDSKNRFSKKYSLPINSRLTEVWFENPELGCKGKIDLIKQFNELVDFKSNKRKESTSKIVNKSNLDLLEGKPNFQAIMYLLHHRQKYPETKLEFIFYYFLSNIEDVVTDNDDNQNNITKITYYPNSFNEQLAKKETFEWLKSTSKRREKFLDKLGFKPYQQALKEIEIPREKQYEKDLIIDACLDELTHKFRKHLDIGRGKDVTEKQLKNRTKGILKKYTRFRKQNYFKEDLDQFQEFLKEKLSELNKYKKTRFPIGDPDLDKIDNRDLLIV